jgi:hypothetical protein
MDIVDSGAARGVWLALTVLVLAASCWDIARGLIAASPLVWADAATVRMQRSRT